MSGESQRPGKRFAWLWLGETLNVLGTSTGSALVPMIAVYALDAAPESLGFLTALNWLPYLVIGIPAGAFIDRRSPRAIMICANLVSIAACASIPIAAWLGALSLTNLMVVAVVLGCCNVFFHASHVSLLPAIVPAPALETANSRLHGSESAVAMAGPSIAGSVVQVGTAAQGMFVQVGGTVISTICLVMIGRVERRVRPPAEPLRRRISAGFQRVFTDRYLRNLMLTAGVANFGTTGIHTLFVLFLGDELGLSAAAVGVVLTVGSAGGVVGALAAPSISKRIGNARALVMLQALLLSLVIVPLTAVGAPVAVVAASVFVSSFGVVAGNVIRSAWRQRYVEPEVLARVSTVMQLVNFGGMPLAGIAAGFLGGAVGMRPTMLIMSGITLTAVVWLALGPLRGLRDLPPRQGGDAAERADSLSAAE